MLYVILSVVSVIIFLMAFVAPVLQKMYLKAKFNKAVKKIESKDRT